MLCGQCRERIVTNNALQFSKCDIFIYASLCYLSPDIILSLILRLAFSLTKDIRSANEVLKVVATIGF